MSTTEVKVGGLGGQGVILAGIIIGRGASIHDGKNATMTQAFGPEARGSACSSQVIIADEPIEYPYVTCPDILVVMSQEAFNRFASELSPSGTLVYEADLVKPRDVPPTVAQYGIPCTRIAEELRRQMVANIVMVGFIAAVTTVASVEGLRESVKSSVPPETVSFNLAAFDRGYEFGMNLPRSEAPKLAASLH